MKQPMQCPGCNGVFDGVPAITKHMDHCEPAQKVMGFMANPVTVRAAAVNVVRAWERLGACEDEFEEYGLAMESCGEYADHLDSAIIALRNALGLPAPPFPTMGEQSP